ncbi:MAG: glycine zipper 2TM domain-containing protein [Burkholderiaceae bacterium]|jgi:uncharacterized protein YcfJ|nr:glycine zipper 2TM domain-containing protein [Burkholderiaceae bacterium]
MKKIALLSLLAGAAVAAGAQERARVLSATPIVQQVPVPQQVCDNQTVYTGQQTTGGGAVLGAVAGGAVGNAIGGGSGRAAATALGLIGGALLGNQIEGNGRPSYQNVQRCYTQNYYETRTVGYTVVYEYAGRQYTTQTQTDPGRTIDVQVHPTEYGASSPYGRTYSTQPNTYSPPSAGIQEGVYLPPYPQQPQYVGPQIIIESDYYRGDHAPRNRWR